MTLLRSSLRAAAALLVALCVAACTRGGSDKPRFAYVTNGVDPFWTIAEVGARKAGVDLGVEVLVEMPSDGIGHQKQILEDLLTRGVDGIAVSPIDHANQTPLLDEIARRVPLITHDSDAPASKRVAFVRMDNYEAGRMAGDLVKEALPQGGKVMLFVGRLEQDNARLRRQGVIDAILRATPSGTTRPRSCWRATGTPSSARAPTSSTRPPRRPTRPTP